MKVEAIQNILDHFVPAADGSLAKYIAAALADIRGIQDAFREVGAKKQACLEDFQTEVRKLNSELALIREQCHHWSTTFQDDPSGGSDKQTICDFCGKEL